MQKLINLASMAVVSTAIHADFIIGPVPSDAPTGLNVFTKHIDVHGLHVFAKSQRCSQMVPILHAPCTADIDGNGIVGLSDILIVIDPWGSSNGSADIDGSGSVGVGDLLTLVDAWGACPLI
jgi:hypothetical protein